jgi:hypothetical protein
MKPFSQDYSTLTDYDPPDAHWISSTTIGSPYEIEIDTTKQNHSRHRNFVENGPWLKGYPPTNADKAEDEA